MITGQKIAEDVERLTNIKALVETYETIAASSMRRIRNSVLENRIFHEGLHRLYRDVKQAYQKEITKLLAAQKKKRGVGSDGSQEKSVYVFLSANTGLYGDIINKTFQLFLSEWEKKDCPAVVVGKVGKTLMESFVSKKKYSYFDFQDNRIDAGQLKAITEELSAYDHVTAFYGSFKGLLLQEPTFTSVSGADDMSEQKVTDEKFIFEPSLEVVAMFFEKEIFASLLEQVFYESRLAKLSSRMVLLDRASLNIENGLKAALFRSQQFRHRLYNRKQLNSLAGISLWNIT